MKRNAPSIRKIAKIAGVSPMTVSYALRNSLEVSEETRERIMGIAQREGYKPNPLVSTLMSQLKVENRSGTYGTIGFINSYPNRREWFRGHVRPRFYVGVQKRAEEWGYKLEDYFVKAPGMTGAKLSRILKRRNIQGIILGGLPVKRGHLSLKWEWFAPVAHGFSLVKPNVHRVTSNHAAGMLLCLRKLKRHGYRRVGFITTLSGQAEHNTVFTSIFEHNTKRLFKEQVPVLYVKDSWDPNIKKWIHDHNPDVIIALTKYVADFLKDINLSVPNDMGFVSLTTEPGSPITGIDPKFEAIGAAAVDLLVAQIETKTRGLPDAPRNLMIEGSWVQGKTIKVIK